MSDNQQQPTGPGKGHSGYRRRASPARHMARVLALAAFFFALIAVRAPMIVESRDSGTTVQAITDDALDAHFPEKVAMLVAPEAEIDLRDAPGADVVRLSAPAGTLVEVVTGAEVGNQAWFLVQPLNASGQGWAPAEAVVDVEP
jgi:hypothetical protein